MENINDANLLKLKLVNDRSNLPIQEYKDAILYNIKQNNVLILTSPTGSGKSTQIPQFLYEAGWANNGWCIGVTQPRRIAATSIATWIAQELKVELGKQVGYSIRFEEKTSLETKIKLLTDGMLIRELYRDPLLSKYSVIMIDEAHERSITTDLLIALLKKIQAKRPMLKIIIASATVDAHKFEKFFKSGNSDKHKVTTINLSGKSFPVDLLYLKQPCEDYLIKVEELVKEIHLKESIGDILVFLTGREEIESLLSNLLSWSYNQKGKMGLKVLPLYSGLSNEEQNAIFEKPIINVRKVILATNIAETSITIPNISYIIDPGFVKIKVYDPNLGYDRLVIVPISQASAQQRAGRAGRTKPGKAYRLYTEATYHQLSKESVPEIQRSELIETIIFLKALGIQNIAKFDFLISPPSKLVTKALEYLFHIKSVDIKGQLLPLGEKLSELPVHPKLGNMLLQSIQFKCTKQILSIIAMLSIKNVYYKPSSNEMQDFYKVQKKYAVEEGDLITYLNVFNAFENSNQTSNWCYQRYLNFNGLKQAQIIRKQLTNYFLKLTNSNNIPSTNNLDDIRKCILLSLFDKVVQFNSNTGSLTSLNNHSEMFLHPDSILFKRKFDLAVYYNIQFTTKPFIMGLSTIESEWLTQLLPDYYTKKDRKISKDILPMG